MAHYHWNLRLSEALYPVLHLNEVVFRNAMHRALSTEFDTENWFQGLWLHKREQRSIEKVIAELRKRDNEQPINPDQVVAELTFGFWCSLCDTRYEHKQILWPKLLRHSPLRQLPKRQRQRKELSRRQSIATTPEPGISRTHLALERPAASPYRCNRTAAMVQPGSGAGTPAYRPF